MDGAYEWYLHERCDVFFSVCWRCRLFRSGEGLTRFYRRPRTRAAYQQDFSHMISMELGRWILNYGRDTRKKFFQKMRKYQDYINPRGPLKACRKRTKF